MIIDLMICIVIQCSSCYWYNNLLLNAYNKVMEVNGYKK